MSTSSTDNIHQQKVVECLGNFNIMRSSSKRESNALTQLKLLSESEEYTTSTNFWGNDANERENDNTFIEVSHSEHLSYQHNKYSKNTLNQMSFGLEKLQDDSTLKHYQLSQPQAVRRRTNTAITGLVKIEGSMASNHRYSQAHIKQLTEEVPRKYRRSTVSSEVTTISALKRLRDQLEESPAKNLGLRCTLNRPIGDIFHNRYQKPPNVPPSMASIIMKTQNQCNKVPNRTRSSSMQPAGVQAFIPGVGATPYSNLLAPNSSVQNSIHLQIKYPVSGYHIQSLASSSQYLQNSGSSSSTGNVASIHLLKRSHQNSKIHQLNDECVVDTSMNSQLNTHNSTVTPKSMLNSNGRLFSPCPLKLKIKESIKKTNTLSVEEGQLRKELSDENNGDDDFNDSDSQREETISTQRSYIHLKQQQSKQQSLKYMLDQAYQEPPVFNEEVYNFELGNKNKVKKPVVRLNLSTNSIQQQQPTIPLNSSSSSLSRLSLESKQVTDRNKGVNSTTNIRNLSTENANVSSIDHHYSDNHMLTTNRVHTQTSRTESKENHQTELLPLQQMNQNVLIISKTRLNSWITSGTTGTGSEQLKNQNPTPLLLKEVSARKNSQNTIQQSNSKTSISSTRNHFINGSAPKTKNLPNLPRPTILHPKKLEFNRLY